MQPHRRRSSDPQTVRERGDFQRDLRFSKNRPLPNVPWLQDKRRTYMDDAERLHGRKETWYKIEDEVVREKLAALLQDFLRDTIETAKLDSRDARKYMQLCRQMDAEYRAYVTAAVASSLQPLRSWASLITQKSSSKQVRVVPEPDSRKESLLSDNGEDADAEKDEMGNEKGERAKLFESRRRRGTQANLENTPAIMDLPQKEEQGAPYSAFPFLRQRVLEGEATLDPSLVDWTAKYFPEDDDRTFTAPPRLQNEKDDMKERDSASSSFSDKTMDNSRPRSRKFTARHRLQRPLRLHEDARRPTYDAEGVFYRVRRQGDEDDRAPTPRAARGSDANTERDRDVVKVSWDTVVKAKELGYSSDILRAKERLTRLSRGEDPQTIP